MKGGFRQINVILSGDEFRCSACASFQLCRNIDALSIWFHAANAFRIVNQQATHSVGILLQLLFRLGPTASSSAFAELTNMLLDMGEGDTPADRYMSDAAWDYIAKFIDNIDGIVLSSSSQVYKNVIAGEYAVGVSYEDPVVQAIIDNKDNPDADLSLVYPEEGAVWLPAGVAIVKNAPNMDNAKLFVDYVLSEEAQTALSKTTIRGTMTSIAQDCPEMKPFEEINVVYEDQAAVAELQTEMLEKWTNLLTK